MSCRAENAEILRESGHKATRQRVMILTALRHAGGHVTASEIHGLVKDSYPYVDISTVYRTLGMLKEMRLVAETNMGTGESSYEWIQRKPHHHLICRGCGRVTSIDHGYLEAFGEELVRVYGFRADLDHFGIFGLCRECAGLAQQKER